MAFSIRGFFEVALQCWPWWTLNAKPLNSVQTLYLAKVSHLEFKFHSEATLCSYSNIILCSMSDLILVITFVSRHIFLNPNFLEVIFLCVAELNDTYGIHHYRILWSSFAMLTLVDLECKATEFRSDTLFG